MTKAELVERLARDPIVIEPVAKLSYYRIALHGDADRTSGVIMGVGPGGGTWLAEEYEQPYARVGGKTMRLTYREAELIAARLRRIFGEGGASLGTGNMPPGRGRRAIGKAGRPFIGAARK